MLELIAIKPKCAACEWQSAARGKEPRDLINQHKMRPLGGEKKKKGTKTNSPFR